MKKKYFHQSGAANTLMTAGMAGAVGGMTMGRQVGGVLVLAALGGGATVFL